MYHLFINMFICWSNRMAALLLCYHFAALCTSNGGGWLYHLLIYLFISAGAIEW